MKHDQLIHTRKWSEGDEEEEEEDSLKYYFDESFAISFVIHVDLKTDLRQNTFVHPPPSSFCWSIPWMKDIANSIERGIDIKFLPLWITDLTLELNFLLLDLARDGISDRREIFGDRLQRFN